MVLFAIFAASQYVIRHGLRIRPFLLLQVRDDTVTVAKWLVLADFPLTLPAGDGYFYSHYLLNEPLREIPGRIFNFPGSWKASLLLCGQGHHLLPYPIRIVSDPQRTVGMDDGIVPGRYHLAGFALVAYQEGLM